jgi:hypothetical protein
MSDDGQAITNYGLIKGGDHAIYGGVASETVISHGRLLGDVDL